MTDPRTTPAARAPRGARRVLHRLRRLAHAGPLHAPTSPSTTPCARPPGCSTSRTWPSSSSTGPSAGAFLDYALAGRLSTLADDQAKYSLLLDVDGGIIDDVIVYRYGDERYMVVANAGNRDAVAPALVERSLGFDVEVERRDRRHRADRGAGPRGAGDRRGDAPGIAGIRLPLAELKYYRMTHASSPRPARRRPGATSAAPATPARTASSSTSTPPSAPALWDALLAAGEPHGLVPAGLAARDTLRLEAGMPLYGHELSRDIVPAQAGLGRVVAADKERLRRAGRALGRRRLGRARCSSASSPRASAPAAPATPCFDGGRRAGRRDHERRAQPDARASDRHGLRLARASSEPGTELDHRRAGDPHPRDRDRCLSTGVPSDLRAPTEPPEEQVTDLNALKYTAEHEWIALDGDVATVGITDYAADKLGDVVFVDLPAVGSGVTAGQVVRRDRVDQVGRRALRAAHRRGRRGQRRRRRRPVARQLRPVRRRLARQAPRRRVGARRAARPRGLRRPHGRRGVSARAFARASHRNGCRSPAHHARRARLRRRRRARAGGGAGIHPCRRTRRRATSRPPRPRRRRSRSCARSHRRTASRGR